MVVPRVLAVVVPAGELQLHKLEATYQFFCSLEGATARPLRRTTTGHITLSKVYHSGAQTFSAKGHRQNSQNTRDHTSVKIEIVPQFYEQGRHCIKNTWKNDYIFQIIYAYC